MSFYPYTRILPQHWLSSFIWFTHSEWTWVNANGLGHKVTEERGEKHSIWITVHPENIGFHSIHIFILLLLSPWSYTQVRARGGVQLWAHRTQSWFCILSQMLRGAEVSGAVKPHELTTLANVNVIGLHCEFSSWLCGPVLMNLMILFTGTELIFELLLRRILSGCISWLVFR